MIAHYVSTCSAEQQPLFEWESWEGNQGSPSTLSRRWKEQITMPTLHSIAKWHIRDIMPLAETLHSLQSKERAAKEQWILLACSKKKENSEMKMCRCNSIPQVRPFKPHNRSRMYLLTWGIYGFAQYNCSILLDRIVQKNRIEKDWMVP